MTTSIGHTVRLDGSPARPPSPWVGVVVVLLGGYASTLNATVVGVALPAIGRDLGREGAAIEVDWVVTGFLIGVVVALPVTGWSSDWFGRKAVYVSSLAIFGVGALVCLTAQTMEVLVVGRFVQGAGGGALTPVGLAIVYDLFPPHRRGTALGVWGVAVMAGPAVGPPLGGWVVTAGSWRWIFGLFVVIAMVAVVLSLWLLPEVGYREQRPLDVIGWLLAGVGVTVVVVGFRRIGVWGFTSPATALAVMASAAVFTILVRRSLNHPQPVIEFRMFSTPTFSAAMALMGVLFLCQIVQLTFLPLELQVVRRLDPQYVGLLLSPAAVGTAAFMPIAGWLVDRIGARVPVVVGLSLFSLSMWNLGHLASDSSEAFIVGVLVLQGVGLGLAFMPAQVAAMNSLPARFVAQASAVSNLSRQLGGAVGVAALSAVLVADLGAVAPVGVPIEVVQGAYNKAFLLAFWCAVGGTAIALVLPGREATLQHHAERTAELGAE